MFTDGDMCISFNCSEEILINKGGSAKWFYSYFGGFKHLVCYNLIVCCSLDPVLVIWYGMLFWLFLWKINGTFLN